MLYFAAFAGSISADSAVRGEAESILDQLSLIKGVILVLPNVISNHHVDVGTRTAAAVYMKNEVRRRWTAQPSKNFSNSFTEEEKNAFRHILVPLVVSVVSDEFPISIANPVEECVRIVAHADYPTSWPNIMDTVAGVSSNRIFVFRYDNRLLTVLLYICVYICASY